MILFSIIASVVLTLVGNALLRLAPPRNRRCPTSAPLRTPRRGAEARGAGPLDDRPVRRAAVVLVRPTT